MKLLLVFSLNFVCIVFCKAHFELNASYISIEKLNKNKYSDNHDSLLIVYDRLCDKILSNSLELEHYDTLIFFINNFPDKGLNEGFGEYLYNLFLNNEANNLQFRLILIKHNIQFRKNTQLNLLSLLWLNLQENNTGYEQFLKQFSLFDSFFRLKKEYNKRYLWFSSSP